jgi:hypothetical protein
MQQEHCYLQGVYDLNVARARTIVIGLIVYLQSRAESLDQSNAAAASLHEPRTYRPASGGIGLSWVGAPDRGDKQVDTTKAMEWLAQTASLTGLPLSVWR